MTNNNTTGYPTIPQAFGIFGLYVAFTLGASLLIMIPFLVFKFDNVPLSNLLVYAIAGGLILWFTYQKKIKTEQAGKVFLFGPVSIALSIVLFVITIGIAMVLEPLLNLIPMPEFVEKLFETILEKSIYNLLLVVFIGPVIEELLLRGIILDGFLKRYSPWKAIIWSSIIFGIFHLNPWQFIPAFFIGVLMGYVYWKIRSLLPVIFIHIINNALGYLTSIMSDESAASFADLFNTRSDYLLAYFISLGITVLGILWLIVLTRKKE